MTGRPAIHPIGEIDFARDGCAEYATVTCINAQVHVGVYPRPGQHGWQGVDEDGDPILATLAMMTPAQAFAFGDLVHAAAERAAADAGLCMDCGGPLDAGLINDSC
jgi:hypothetical protein